MDNAGNPDKNREFERAEEVLWRAIDTAYQAGIDQASGNTERAADNRGQVVDTLVPAYREQLGSICGVEVDAYETPPNLAIAGAGTEASTGRGL